MSRIGKAPVSLPQGVDVKIADNQVSVKGPKGTVDVPYINDHVSVEEGDGSLRVARKSEEKVSRALHGLTRSLIANAVTGVSEGFSKNLDLHGVGWRAEAKGSKLTLHVGYSHPVIYDAPSGVSLSVGEGQGVQEHQRPGRRAAAWAARGHGGRAACQGDEGAVRGAVPRDAEGDHELPRAEGAAGDGGARS